MRFDPKALFHAAWGLLLLLLAAIFTLTALRFVERLPTIHLDATPDVGQVMLEWRVRAGESTVDARAYTWEYRRFPLHAEPAACRPTLASGPVPNDPPWQPMSPVVEDTALRFTVAGLAEGVVYAICVRGRADATSALLYSPDAVIAVPSVSPARVRAIEQRLPPLEARLVLPCAGGSGDLLGILRFDVRSSTLPPSDPELSAYNATQWTAIRDKLSARSGGRVVLAGYASADFPASYNLDLSERRVEAVLAQLQDAVDDQREFSTIAVGEEHARVRSRTEVPAERRVEVHWCQAGG